MKYNVVRTDTADAGLRKIVLYIAQNFGNDVALKKLDEIGRAYTTAGRKSRSWN
ncbi:MAG: hypothetical protein ACLVBP_12260 [Ruminococcus sp.]